MHVSEISYGESIDIGNYWKRVGVKVAVESGDKREEAVDLAISIVERMKQKVLPPGITNPVVVTSLSETKIDESNSKELEALKTKVNKAKTKEAAEKIIEQSGNWQQILKLITKSIVSQKPSKSDK